MTMVGASLLLRRQRLPAAAALMMEVRRTRGHGTGIAVCKGLHASARLEKGLQCTVFWRGTGEDEAIVFVLPPRGGGLLVI